MSWHYLQGQEEASSEAICWDGERFAPSSGPTTLGGYCLPDSETESCLDSRSGMMSRPSTEIPGEDESMSSQEDSHARTSAQPGKAQESTAQGLECGSTWQGSFARYDPASRSWKTAQFSLLEGLDEFSETWPRWGTMRNGVCWERTILVPPTSEIGFGFSELLPTPLASTATHGGPNQRDSSGRPGLQMAAMMWPNPLSSEGSGGGNAGYALAAINGEKRKSGATRSLKLRDVVLAFPTPTVNDVKNSSLPPSQINRDSLIGDVMRNWPTPRAGNPGSRPNGKGGKILAEEVKKKEENMIPGGQLNPDWVEWLMGWPLAWTDLKPLGMDRFQQWRQQHSGFFQKGF